VFCLHSHGRTNSGGKSSILKEGKGGEEKVPSSNLGGGKDKDLCIFQ